MQHLCSAWGTQPTAGVCVSHLLIVLSNSHIVLTLELTQLHSAPVIKQYRYSKESGESSIHTARKVVTLGADSP